MDERIRKSITEENHESDGSHMQTLLHNAENRKHHVRENTSHLNAVFSTDMNLIIKENN